MAAAVNQSVKEQFGAVAAAYAVSAVHAGGPDLTALIAAAELTGSEQVLDMGCGAGHTGIAAAANAAHVTALDVTPEMLAVAANLAQERGRTNMTFCEGDVMAMPFEDATFDVVTSRFSAHHYGDPARALAEAYRVLKPGGQLLLVDSIAQEDATLDTFYNCFELLRDSSHVRNWRGSEWMRMLAAAGFAGEMLDRYVVRLDGASWVQRMRTPANKVAMVQELFRDAPAHVRAAFECQDEPWMFSIPSALLRGRKPA
ncbi:hypothetical protein AYO38_00275 [bacterium SCGC AG-212-C10]|nr:hypothetical protein AYO38_00275 [bacterium SCGC AG-212-C10]